MGKVTARTIPLKWEDVVGAYPCKIDSKGRIVGLSGLPSNSEALLLIRSGKQSETPEVEERLGKLETTTESINKKLTEVLEYLVKKK